MVVDGHGHVIRQTCFEKRLLRQDGTGYLELHELTLTRGGADGPGAAVTSRGEISIFDSVIKQNLSEEPGGGVFSMRRVTVHRSRINGNLANDDGGGVYARRGGVEVYDSVLSTNLVDGSGGAIGSTGDITVVRSEVDGNTTDGDGGALYTDEDGDVTVVDSLIDGSDADGPGGAIFTLDGDVAVLNSTLIGNRADDRGGAISGEADVLLVNSTVARNLAVAHAGGGVWARGNLMLVNSTVTNNYAEGDGGGTLSAGRTTLINSTLTRNIASVGGNVGSAGRLFTRGSIIGPGTTEGVTGDTIPTRRICRVYELSPRATTSSPTKLRARRRPRPPGRDPELSQLEDDPKGFVLLPAARQPGDRPGCRPTPAWPELPAEVPAGQLLASYVDWPEVLSHDAVGTPRDDGKPCDIGAVEYPTHRGRSGAGSPCGAGPRRVVPPADRARRASAPRSSRASASTCFAGPRPDRSLRRARWSGSTVGCAPSSNVRSACNEQANRFDVLARCTAPLAVDQIGDPEHRYGLVYDERDGTGADTRTALVPAPGRHGTRPAAAAPVPQPVLPEQADRPQRQRGERPGRPHRVAAASPWPACAAAAPPRAPGRPHRRGHEPLRRLGVLPVLASVTEDGDARQDLGFVSTSGDPAHPEARARHRPRQQRVGRPRLPAARIHRCEPPEREGGVPDRAGRGVRPRDPRAGRWRACWPGPRDARRSPRPGSGAGRPGHGGDARPRRPARASGRGRGGPRRPGRAGERHHPVRRVPVHRRRTPLEAATPTGTSTA